MDGKKRWVLFRCLTSLFLSYTMLYQMAPFFQRFAEETTGASTSTVGFIFAALPSAAFVASFPTACLVKSCGPPLALSVGLLLLAVSTLGFGLSRSVLGWLAWRCVQGAATAPIYTSVNCILAATFRGPGEFEQASAWQATVVYLGYTLGPIFGGSLFQFGGFLAPFALSAICHLLFVLLTDGLGDTLPYDKDEVLLPGDSDSSLASSTSATLWEVCFPRVVLLVGAAMLVQGMHGALDLTIATHLRACLGDVPNATVGMLVGLKTVIPVFFAAPVVRLLPGAQAYLIAVGLFLMALVALIFGGSDPSGGMVTSYLDAGSSVQWVSQLFGLVAIGVGTALAWTLVLPEMLKVAAIGVAEVRGEASPALDAVTIPISAVFNAGAAMGEAAGSVLGGRLVEVVGFGNALLLLAVVCSAFAFLLAISELMKSQHPGDFIAVKHRGRSSSTGFPSQYGSLDLPYPPHPEGINITSTCESC